MSSVNRPTQHYNLNLSLSLSLSLSLMVKAIIMSSQVSTAQPNITTFLIYSASLSLSLSLMLSFYHYV